VGEDLAEPQGRDAGSRPDKEDDMRIFAFLGAALSTVGCLSVQPSIHPWLAPQDAVAVPGIEGVWVEEQDDHPLTMAMGRLPGGTGSNGSAGPPAYVLTVLEQGRPSRGALGLSFGHLDGALYWDLTALPVEETADLWSRHLLGMHSLARITLEGDRLEVAPLDPSWVGKGLENGGLSLDHLILDDCAILAAPTADLQRLVLEHAFDDGAFAAPAVFSRLEVSPAAE
jgi:hypothetical protein